MLAQPVMAMSRAASAHYGIPLATLGVRCSLQGRRSIHCSIRWSARSAIACKARFGRRRPWDPRRRRAVHCRQRDAVLPARRGLNSCGSALGSCSTYCGASALSTPLMAWSGEISGDYHELTRIASLFTLLSSCALVLALVLLARDCRPAAPRRRATAANPVRHAGARHRDPGPLAHANGKARCCPAALEPPISPSAGLRAVLTNPLMLRVLAADAAVTAGQGAAHGPAPCPGHLRAGPAGVGGRHVPVPVFVRAPAAPMAACRPGARQGARCGLLAEVAQSAINLALLFVTAYRFWLMLPPPRFRG